ncbi:hypothetical protein ZIOFF_017641 [Zingiber officinale]|nr:hypothetical protein ZIOFF_017641 [Zingiber officinale]
MLLTYAYLTDKATSHSNQPKAATSDTNLLTVAYLFPTSRLDSSASSDFLSLPLHRLATPPAHFPMATALTMLIPSSPSLAPVKLSSSAAFFGPTKAVAAVRPRRAGAAVAVVRASWKEKALAVAAAALVVALPEVAEAAQPGFSPSLKNFLLSIVSGGVVLAAIGGAVIAVSNFDPVKRT